MLTMYFVAVGGVAKFSCRQHKFPLLGRREYCHLRYTESNDSTAEALEIPIPDHLEAQFNPPSSRFRRSFPIFRPFYQDRSPALGRRHQDKAKNRSDFAIRKSCLMKRRALLPLRMQLNSNWMKVPANENNQLVVSLPCGFVLTHNCCTYIQSDVW